MTIKTNMSVCEDHDDPVKDWDIWSGRAASWWRCWRRIGLRVTDERGSSVVVNCMLVCMITPLITPLNDLGFSVVYKNNGFNLQSPAAFPLFRCFMPRHAFLLHEGVCSQAFFFPKEWCFIYVENLMCAVIPFLNYSSQFLSKHRLLFRPHLPPPVTLMLCKFALNLLNHPQLAMNGSIFPWSPDFVF